MICYRTNGKSEFIIEIRPEIKENIVDKWKLRISRINENDQTILVVLLLV